MQLCIFYNGPVLKRNPNSLSLQEHQVHTVCVAILPHELNTDAALGCTCVLCCSSSVGDSVSLIDPHGGCLTWPGFELSCCETGVLASLPLCTPLIIYQKLHYTIYPHINIFFYINMFLGNYVLVLLRANTVYYSAPVFIRRLLICTRLTIKKRIQ